MYSGFHQIRGKRNKKRSQDADSSPAFSSLKSLLSLSLLDKNYIFAQKFVIY
jgi:hypothetical protein